MTIQNCLKCGGTHYGSNICPYLIAPCIICGENTVFARSDCAIESGGKLIAHICNKIECRIKHEIIHNK